MLLAQDLVNDPIYINGRKGLNLVLLQESVKIGFAYQYFTANLGGRKRIPRGPYLPFLRLANSFGIPWYIFSDGEAEALKRAQAALDKVNDPEKASRLFPLPSGECFEKFFAKEKYKDILVKMIISLESKNEKHRAALEKEWAAKANPLEETLAFLLANKTRCAKPLALAVTGLTDDELRFPGAIKDLLKAVSDEHKIKREKTRNA